MNKFDVVIVGGGTAGLILAREFCKLKRKTLVVDRKDNLLEFSFNTLASFMDLKEFDLSENVVAQKIKSAVLYSKNFTKTLKGDAYILDKKIVHEELLAAIDTEFITIKTGVHIKEIKKDDADHFTAIVDKNGNEYTGKIFIDASGTNGVISKQVGLREKKVKLATGVEYNVKYLGEPSEGHLFVGKQYQGGYGWIFPLKNQRAIVGFGTFDNTVVKDLKPRLNQILEIPVIKKLVVKDNETVEGGSIPLTPVLDQFIINNLVCVGDSVSQVNPIVGEGYKFIFEAALMASKAIEKTLKNDDLTHLSEYETDWKKRFSANYKRGKYSQEKIFKYSKNDFLVNIGMLLLRLRSNESITKSLSGEYFDTKNT